RRRLAAYLAGWSAWHSTGRTGASKLGRTALGGRAETWGECIAMTSIRLPESSGTLGNYQLSTRERVVRRTNVTFNRIAYAAAHVVPNPLADNSPFIDSNIDWDTTLAYRRHLWDMGLGVAESMDTAQRGMGVDWPTSLELIQRSM